MPEILRTFALLVALLLTAACDDPAETARRVESLRGGCTEEGLRETSEECIATFDSLAAAGEDAFEIYLGALAAFDSSLQRRRRAAGDTALLDAVLHAGADTFPRPTGPRGWRPERARRERHEHDGEAYPDERYDGYSREHHEERYRDPEEYGRGYETYDGYGREYEHRRYDGYPPEREEHAAPPVPPRRGVLLPPEERLRRPWIREERSAPPRRHPPRREWEPPPRPRPRRHEG